MQAPHGKDPFGLVGRRILITGASSGIGKACAVAAAQAGAACLLQGRRSDSLEAVRASLAAPEAHGVVCGDLLDEAYRASLLGSLPGLHGMVHAAGAIDLLPLRLTEDDALDAILDLNFGSAFALVRDTLRSRKLERGASIVLMSSVTGPGRGLAGGSAYGASKGALEGFMKSAALELARKGIRINALAPGMVETEGLQRIKSQLSQQAIEADIRRYPLGRYGRPEEVAHAAQYLLSDASAWVTGQTLVIDGGLTAA